MAVVYPATTNDEAVSLNIDNANKFHEVVNGDINTTVETYEGNGDIPSVAKALHDAAAYKVPIAWDSGETETDLLQPRIFGSNVYVPLTVPADMSSSPDSEWRLYSINGTSESSKKIQWVEINSNTVLDGTYLGKSLWVTASCTITLPVWADNEGFQCEIIPDESGPTITIDTQGSDTTRNNVSSVDGDAAVTATPATGTFALHGEVS